MISLTSQMEFMTNDLGLIKCTFNISQLTLALEQLDVHHKQLAIWLVHQLASAVLV